jgi:hypothetical protein
MVDVNAILQVGAVFFGTVIAAPLLSSDSKKLRYYGFATMLIGNSFALALHVSLSLWILSAASIFWALMSMRGVWLNRPTGNDASQSVNVTSEKPASLPHSVPDLVPGE